MITADEELVNEKKEQWQRRFMWRYLRRCPENETGTLFSG